MHLSYEGPTTLRANQLFTAKLRVRLDEPLQQGGRVVLAARHFSDLGDPQQSDPAAENFISIDGPGEWDLGPAHDGKRHPWNRGIELRINSGELPAGETLSVVMGDPKEGCPGYRAQSFSEFAFRFRLGVDRTGQGDWVVLPPEECPAVRITGNEAVALKASVPRATSGGEHLAVHVKPEDAYGNIAGDAPSQASLFIDDTAPAGQVELKPDQAGKANVTVPTDSSWRRITVATEDGRFWARSNPFGPSPLKDYELFFGEIHSQSALCDGTNQPEELYAYAREAVGLDFAAVSSHDFELTDRDWEVIRKATKDAHLPGEFVTFLGVEWSGKPAAGGDNNIYFLDDDGPLVYSAPFGGYSAWDPAEGQVGKSRTLSEVIEDLRGRHFMVVPHCGGRRCNLDYYDASVMPLFEIHSCHRTYEDVANEALRRGIRFGFIGGSDDHRGALGDSHTAARDRFYTSHNGLVAAYAKELTRESLWEAFFARRVYATNGPRIVLTTDIDGHAMGSEVHAEPGATLKLSFWACLDGMPDRVEVMRDDSLVKTFHATRRGTIEISGEMELSAAADPHAYYIRVFQTDGGRAWSTPIWVVPAEQ